MSESSELSERIAEAKSALPLLGALGWAPFIAECSWIVDYLDDVESDLSAFHRIDDYRTLSSARFFSLALRLGAYAGVIQARAYAESKASEPARSPRGEVVRTVDDSVALAELEAAGLLEREVA